MMKRFLLFVEALFVCGVAFAHTVNWHDGNTTTQTTCNAGDNITPPTPIGKYGYHFKEWNVGYTRIEYLESTGTQWIDTGFYPSSNIGKKEISLAWTNSNCLMQIFDASNEHDSNWYANYWAGGGNTLNLYLGTTGSISSASITPIIQQKHYLSVEFNNGNFTRIFDDNIVNGTYSGTVVQNNNTVSLFSFRYYNRNACIKVYEAKIWQDNTIVRDFIPVLDKNDTPCMYDKVEKKFYYNRGTGQFIAGPAI